MSHLYHGGAGHDGDRLHSVHQNTNGDFKRGVTENQKATIRAFDKFYSMFPSFIDIFPDEDAFLDFAFWFVVVTVVTVTILAKFVKIKPSTYI